MPSAKVKPFLVKISSKKIANELNFRKLLLMIILGCLSVALIVGIIIIIVFSTGIFKTIYYT